MKRFLPLFLILSLAVTFLFSAQQTYAQTGPNGGGTNQPGGNSNQPIGGIPALPTQPLQTAEPSVPVPTGRWVVDPEVTFAGKNAARSGLLLDWTLQNYNWVCVHQVLARTCDDSNNPISKYWTVIVGYLVIPMLFFVVLATAAVMIITRGRSLTMIRFLPRFVAVVLLIVFSYSMVQFFYQFTDMIQGFFLRSGNLPCPPDCISQKDLLYVGWDYRSFVGIRLLGDYYAESAFISTLYTKLTAFTYFVMSFTLLMRKIILWFFIIVSPIFPILLLYYPLRNTGKIWIGEFFRWLMYAPLFAVFLKGLVFMWRNQIPLWFVPPGGPGDIGNTSKIIFPTPINIILGGPQQFVTPTNSMNLTETFALYTVSLLMLWVVMLLPWVLLKIFLEYGGDFGGSGAVFMKAVSDFAIKQKIPIVPKKGPEGAAMAIPFAKKFHVPDSVKELTLQPATTARQVPQTRQVQTPTNQQTVQQVVRTQTTQQRVKVDTKVAEVSNVQLPSIRDIAKFETSLISRNKSQQETVTQAVSNLEKIANPAQISNMAERQKYQDIRDKLVKEKEQGNPVATNILKAADTVSQAKQQQTAASLKKASTNQVKESLQEIANPALSSSSKNKEQLVKLREKLSQASTENKSQLASSILSVNQQTSAQDVEKIREKLLQSKKETSEREKELASSVTTTISNNIHQKNQTKNVKATIQQIKNPAASPKMHDTLVKASQQGNQLASQILSFNEQASDVDVESLHDKIIEAKQKGDPVATQIAELTQTAIPQVNRIQEVRSEDYQAVKDMWKENYKNLEVPDGMAGSRTDWMKDDIDNIDEIIGKLSSTDQDQVSQGLEEVSNILPFLMVGGFSQTEIISYLRAKQDAAKEITTELAAEEETKVSVEIQKKAGERTMAATLEEEEKPKEPNEPAASEASGSAKASTDEADEPKEEDTESPLKDVLEDQEPAGGTEQKGVDANVQKKIK